MSTVDVRELMATAMCERFPMLQPTKALELVDAALGALDAGAPLFDGEAYAAFSNQARAEHENEQLVDRVGALTRELRNVRAGVWGGLQLLDGPKHRMGVQILRSCLPADYRPVGA